MLCAFCCLGRDEALLESPRTLSLTSGSWLGLTLACVAACPAWREQGCEIGAYGVSN